jgi:hypothetical protein
MMPASTALARALLLVFAAAPGAVWAGKFDYSLYVGVEHSDNITLSATDPVSQNVLIPGLNFSYLQQGSTFQANVLGTLEYRDYPGGQFDNQTQTQLAAQANWTVLPQRLDLSMEDYAAVQPVDSLASNAPGNQQQTNVLSIGPTLHLQFGDAMRGQAELRYINSYASKVSEFNSSRGVAAFRLYRDISPTDQVSANIETQRVSFDNGADAGPNYTRNEGFLRYTSKLARFNADVQVGWSQLSFDHAPSDSSPMARLTVGWQPTVRTSFSVSGSYEYADAAQDMMLTPGQASISDLNGDFGGVTGGGTLNGSGISTGSAVVDSQVYLQRLVEATYAFNTERWTLSIAPLYRKLHYLNDPTFDQVGRGGSVNVTYRLRPTLLLSGFATDERLQYQTLDRTDRTLRFGLDLNSQWTPHWSWHASVIRQRRNSDAVNQSYRETELFFGVVYRR